MDSTLKKVLELLSASNPELQCAAAKVIGEIGASTSVPVIRALGEASTHNNLAVRCAALEALGKSGRTEALPFILPHLTSPQLGERNGAIAAIATLGSDALPAAVKELQGEDPVVRLTLLLVLQRLPLADSLPYLLDVLASAEQETVNQICEDFRNRLGELTEERREQASECVRKWLNRPAIRRTELALAAGLRLLGALRDETALPLCLKILQEDASSPRVIRQALLALGKLSIPAKAQPEVWKILSKILRKEKNPSLVQPASEIATHFDPAAFSGKDLLALLDHSDEMVQFLAVRKLGELGLEEAIGPLVARLESAHWRLQQEILGSLQRCPNAGAEILKVFESLEDEALAGHIVHTLQELRPEFTKAQFEKFFDRGVTLQESGKPQASAFLNLLSSLDGEAFTDKVLEQSRKEIRAGNYQKAAGVLGLVPRGVRSTEVKYLLALTRFKLSPKGILQQERENNRSLGMLAELIDVDGMDLGEKILKDENLLEPSEIYCLGFHFVEQVGKLRQFGAQLLSHLARKSPRSREGKDAKSKLKTAGVED